MEIDEETNKLKEQVDTLTNDVRAMRDERIAVEEALAETLDEALETLERRKKR